MRAEEQKDLLEREFAMSERELRIMEGQIALLRQQQKRLRTGNEARILALISERKLLSEVYLVRTLFPEWRVLLEPQDDTYLSPLIPYFYRNSLMLVNENEPTVGRTGQLSLSITLPGAKLVLFTSSWHWVIQVGDWAQFIPFMEQEKMYLHEESVDDLVESVRILNAKHTGEAETWKHLIRHLKHQ